MKKGFGAFLALCLLLMAVLAAPASAQVSYMPNVTAEMSSPAFWAAKNADADTVLLNTAEIAALNAATFARDDNMTTDLKNAPATYDGLALNEATKSGAEADMNYYLGWTYGEDGKAADKSYYQPMVDNCRDPHATSCQSVRYGLAVRYTPLLSFPCDKPIMDDPTDPDFDYASLSGIKVNEPLLVYNTSRDGQYYYVTMYCCSGWVRACDVALCRDRAEWLAAWDIPEQETLVVLTNKVYTELSNNYPEASRLMLTLGTRLRSVDPATVDGLVVNRSPFHSYVVELPTRRADGSYQKLLALIPETARVSEGILPLTKRNIATVATNCLGSIYGWGGMLGSDDCAGVVRNIYGCFGLVLPINRQWHTDTYMIDLSGMCSEEKEAMLDRLPLGTALSMPSHEVLYMGKNNGSYIVFNSSSSMMDPADPTRRLRTRDMMLNDLNVRRTNGRTWLYELEEAFMPAYSQLSGKNYAFPAPLWYHDAVGYCMEKGLMSADADGYFGVNRTVTREEVLLALWQLAGSPAVEGSAEFADIPADYAHADAVVWAVDSGVMTGYGKDKAGVARFGLADPVTREQVTAVLCRLAKMRGLDTSARASLTKFKDQSSISAYARPTFGWACAKGLLCGISADTLAPQGRCTRSQLAAIVYRYHLLEERERPAVQEEAAPVSTVLPEAAVDAAEAEEAADAVDSVDAAEEAADAAEAVEENAPAENVQ